MYILRIVKQENNRTYNAVISNNKGIKSLSQNEFNKLTNELIAGTKCYVEGLSINCPVNIYPIFKYEGVNIASANQIPEVIKAQVNKDTKLLDIVVKYNEEIKDKISKYIEKRTKYIQNLEVRNRCYKAIMKATPSYIVCYSPCLKTKYEVQAEKDFERVAKLTPTEISEQQIAYVQNNARKWGLDIPTTDYYIASRKAVYTDNRTGHTTDHGYTEEIQFVVSSRDNYFPSKGDKNYKNALHPENIPEEWMVKSLGTTNQQYKEVYDMIKYFENLPINLQDEFIDVNYVRCPHCGEITRKVNDGLVVTCEYCYNILEELVLTNNDHLLYGTDIDDVYSNLEDIKEYLNNSELEEEGEY